MIGTQTILFVEDDEATRYAIARMLEHSGFRVLAASGFSEAMAAIEGGESIDLMLTDVKLQAGMPHGFALSVMAQSKRPYLRVLFVSGFRDVLDVDHAPRADGRILLKPVDPDDLVKAVRSALAGA